MASDFRLKERPAGTHGSNRRDLSEIATIHHLGHCPLPSVDAVVDICQDLKEILFQAIGSGRASISATSPITSCDLIDSLHDR